MTKFLRTRNYLIHEYLVLIDSHEQYQKYGVTKETAIDIIAIADMLLKVTNQKAQEVYDEIIVLELAEHLLVEERDCIFLTQKGLKRLQNRFYIKEHWKFFESKLTTYTIIIANVVLAAVGLWLTWQTNKTKGIENKLQEIQSAIKEKNITIPEERTLIVRDTVYLPSSKKKKNN